ncbi:hypothetical protein [Nocardioides marmotae]|uniref:hypothetical protein n=1 Tax=Nocardioides marmotae TaxID=2663857 RepID=UPI0012B5522E|nr:hypothetical protein [Nocardioides marmotae]MBC9733720.1 hypothetical protein [Nocardioides marmotae]MTB84823.1 hypothetical protein [Nocardioides marmotae]
MGATEVQGDNFAARYLRLVVQNCIDPADQPTEAPGFRIARGPAKVPFGQRSIGWVPADDGYGIGPLALVRKPSTVSAISVRAYSPNARTNPVAVVRFVEPNRAGEWRGFAALPLDTTAGWHQVTVPLDTQYQWRHFDADGVQDDTSSPLRLVDFVNDRGGDSEGAHVGVLHGCDGDPFYIDGLSVTSEGGAQTYDFDGYRTKLALAANGATKKTIRIVNGQKVNLSARVREALGGAGASGRVKIEAKGFKDKKFKVLVNKQVKAGSPLRTTVRPSKKTIYRASFPGTASHEASATKLTVLVRPFVRAALTKRTVVKGSTFTIRGAVLPSRRAGIQLQKYSGGSWKTVAKSSTSKNGEYAISSRSARLGRSYWRIRVAGGQGNIWGRSAWVKLKTVAPPPPNNGGGSPTPPSPPTTPPAPTPPPPNEPTPEPPGPES